MKTEIIVCDICRSEIKGPYVQVKRAKNNIALDICEHCRYMLILLDKLGINRESYKLATNIDVTQVKD
jgi:hypothetical protein